MIGSFNNTTPQFGFYHPFYTQEMSEKECDNREETVNSPDLESYYIN